jgi:hypothetical protein
MLGRHRSIQHARRAASIDEIVRDCAWRSAQPFPVAWTRISAPMAPARGSIDAGAAEPALAALDRVDFDTTLDQDPQCELSPG